MEKIENGDQMQAFVDGLQNSQPYQFGNSAEFEIEKQAYNAGSPLQEIGRASCRERVCLYV